MSNNDARIRWKHFDDERLQLYEVYIYMYTKKYYFKYNLLFFKN